MTLSARVGQHLRGNAVAYLALFVALTGTAYAAKKITTKQIKKNAIVSSLIKDGEVTSVDVADNGLTGVDIDESTLQNVPVLLADGSVTTIKLADQAVTLPKLADAAVSSAKIADGTIADADIAPGAAIDDSKLGTINDAGKVADAALSSNVALLGGTQTFTGFKTFNDVTVNAGGTSNQLVVAGSRTGSATQSPFLVDFDNDTSSGAQTAASVLNDGGSSGATETLLSLGNTSGTPVTTGLSAAGTIGTALDVSPAAIGTALDIGANDIKTSVGTISSTELDELNGDVDRALPLPLTSFVNSTDGTELDFTPSNGTSPDLVLSSGILGIEYDDDSDGGGADTADNDFISTSFTVPPDYSSGGFIRIARREFGSGGVTERWFCEGGDNSSGFVVSDTMPTGVGSLFTGSSVLNGIDYDPNDTIHFRCRFDDGSGGNTYNDPAEIRSVEFVYSATH